MCAHGFVTDLNKLHQQLRQHQKVNNSLFFSDKFKDLKFTFSNKTKYNIYFRDSVLLLPSSLIKLTDNFKVDSALFKK